MHRSSVAPSIACTTDEVIETGVVKRASHVAQLVVLSVFLLTQRFLRYPQEEVPGESMPHNSLHSACIAWGQGLVVM